LTAADLIAWTQTILLDRALAKAEPKVLRYRLLHTAARIIHRGHRTVIKIAVSWPWAEDLAVAFSRLARIRQPCWPDQPARPYLPTIKDPQENRTPGRRNQPCPRTEDQQLGG
jgi:hypothetical protein